MSKRGQNEGTIYRRSDRRWVATVSAGLGRRKSFYAPTRGEAAAKLAKAISDLEAGVQLLDDRVRVGDFLVEWLESVARPRIRPSTYRRYEQLVRTFLVPQLGTVRLSQLKPMHVQAVLNRASASGLKPMTVHHIRAVLRTALNDALRWDLVTRNAAALAESPRQRRPEVAFLDADQAREFLASLGDDRYGPLYVLAMALGLRQGEALGLSWLDCDFETGTIRIRNALQRLDRQWSLVDPKSESSRRTLPMPAIVRSALQRQRALQAEQRLLAGTRWQETGFVFTSAVGTPLEGVNVTHRLQRALAAAGLPRLRFHDLRHTAASLLLAEGVPARVVMETLGHSQISLTLNTYSHVTKRLLGEAAAAMDRVLGPPAADAESPVAVRVAVNLTPKEPQGGEKGSILNGAGERNRTPNRRFTKPLLYR